MKFGGKLESWSYQMDKFHNPNFNRFSHVTDRQTDGR